MTVKLDMFCSLAYLMQTPESDELPVLELDLGWQLPDFAAIGMCEVIHIYWLYSTLLCT